jgi:GH25 family lysozyme M1 (1,4-beta-N-acetylmuramidase)
MTLRFVDISSWQGDAGLDPAALDCDGVVVKVTGGTSYVNPYWREQADAVLASGKLLAFYHYAEEYGIYNAAFDEAVFFLDRVKDYAGKFVPALDFEADAQSLPLEWVKAWFEKVAENTNATPFFYAYASYLNSRDHSLIVQYPLWMASYLFRYDGAGWVDDPVNTWATSNWPAMTMYQYTSTGYIDGYDGRLDLNIYYGDHESWNALKGGERKSWPVQMYPSNGTLAQRWHVKRNEDGTVTLISAANGKALDVSGMSHDDDAVIQVYEPNGTDAQKFLLKRLEKTANGVRYNPPDYAPFELTPSYDPSKRVEVRHDEDGAGATVQLYAANGTPAQQWHVLDNGDGTITLLDNSKSKLALDVVGGGR